MAISSEIQRLQNAKNDLKTSINAKLGSSTPISNETLDGYAEFVDNISTGIEPTGTIDITENGTHNVTNYASANVNVPSNVNAFAKSIFDRSITELKAEYFDGITNLGEYTFSKFNDVENWVDIFPNTLTSLSGYCFYNAGSYKKINLPSSVNNVNVYCFRSSWFSEIDLSQTQINIFNSVNVYDCSRLTTLKLPSGLTSIGNQAIYNCALLNTVIILAVVPPSLYSTNFGRTPIATSTTEGFIYVPDESVNAYKSATNWSTYADKIKGISELPTE